MEQTNTKCSFAKKDPKSVDLKKKRTNTKSVLVNPEA